MKKLNVVIAFVFVLALFAIPASQNKVYAQSGVSWGSTFQVLNLSDPSSCSPSQEPIAHIYVYYYNQDGSPATMANQPGTTTPYANPVSDTVNCGESNTYNPVHAASGFSGSVMVSSDVPVAIISNEQINTTYHALDSYDGIPSGGASIFFPLVMKGNSNLNSSFTIQNTGGGSTTITVTLTGQPKVNPTDPTFQTITLPTVPLNQGGSYTFDLASNVPQITDTRWIGSVTATVSNPSTDLIAGIVNTVSSKYSYAYQLSSYNAVSDGSQTVLLPLIYQNNNGYRTTINCQNLDPTATVTMNFEYTPGINPSTGSPFPAKSSDSRPGIVPNGLATVIMDYTGTTKWVGSAIVSSTPSAKLACIVNQQKPAAAKLSTYLGIDPSAATNTIVFPLIQSKNGNPAVPANGNWYTTMNLAFVDGAVHSVTCSYVPSPGFSTPSSTTVSDSASPVISQKDIFGNGTKFVGSAICVSTDGTGIFGVVNQQREYNPSSLAPAQIDYLATYNGFSN